MNKRSRYRHPLWEITLLHIVAVIFWTFVFDFVTTPDVAEDLDCPMPMLRVTPAMTIREPIINLRGDLEVSQVVTCAGRWKSCPRATETRNRMETQAIPNRSNDRSSQFISHLDRTWKSFSAYTVVHVKAKPVKSWCARVSNSSHHLPK